MSIATELQNLNDNILDAYTAVQGKGGTVPANKNMVNLPTAISSISGGGGVGVPREIDANGVYQMPYSSFTFSLPNTATRVGANALNRAFYESTGLTAVDLRNVTRIDEYGLNNAFVKCTNLTSLNLSGLNKVSMYGCESMCLGCTRLTSVAIGPATNLGSTDAFKSAFQKCTSLTTIDFSSVETAHTNVFEQVCYDCSSLTSASFSSLTKIGSYGFSQAFYRCTSLTSVNFSSLNTISSSYVFQSAFYGCTSLTSLSFPSLTTTSFGSYTNQFNNMLSGCSNVTVHFPAAIQTTIGSWSSVTGGFGGTNTTVLFDL